VEATPATGGLRRLVPVAGVIALLVAAMVGARFGGPAIPRLLPDGAVPVPTPSPSATAASAAPDSSSSPTLPSTPLVLPEWIGWIMVFACAALVFGIVLAIGWFLMRELFLRLRQAAATTAEGAPNALRPARDVIADAVDLGLAELDESGSDPRRVIIACWARLEQAARDAGMARGVADTATDVVRRLLSTQMVVSEVVLDRLAAAYLEARYAHHLVSDELRDEARAAFLQLRSELHRPVALAEAPAPGGGAS
jgi:hypothetical protein